MVAARGEDFGLTEQYVIYNPGGSTAQMRLSLVAPGERGSLGSATNITVGPYGTDLLTTNGQPWALPGIGYAAHLQSTNGVPVVAARLVTAESPWPYRGTGVVLGITLAARQWLVPPNAQLLAPSELLDVVDPGRAGRWSAPKRWTAPSWSPSRECPGSSWRGAKAAPSGCR